MKVILIFVSALDGKVTKWGSSNLRIWTSHQDQDYYNEVWQESKLIIMGSNTYRSDHPKPSMDHLLIVMTGHPDKYRKDGVPGQLEFTDESPKKLVARFKEEGRKMMLVVGGPHVATSFLKRQLVDELWLTLEPKIFGVGSNFAMEKKLDISLKLIHFDKVNEQGTLITKYQVLKNHV